MALLLDRQRERLSAVRRALTADRALTSGQLGRYYQLPLQIAEVAGLYIHTVHVAATQGGYQYQAVRFISTDADVTRLDANSLRHLAGVAETRHVLGAPWSVWTSHAGARFQPHEPDATWRTADGVVAIEFDAGSYQRTQIESKAQVFSRYASQVWASSSRARARYLKHTLTTLGVEASVVFVDWMAHAARTR